MQDNRENVLQQIAPLPKLLAMVMVLIAAAAVQQVEFLMALIAVEVGLIFQTMPMSQAKGFLVGMGICSAFVGFLQILYLPISEVALILCRMLVMSLVFPPLLATMRMRDLRDTLIHQLRIPYDYAFMFTTALRYVPDLMSDAKHIMEAQSCRGCDFQQGTPWQRLKRYVAILAPLIMHGLNRAETLAMSMDLRGYTGERIQVPQPIHLRDMGVMVGLVMLFSLFIALGR